MTSDSKSQKPVVEYEQFAGLDLRVGLITSAELAEGMRSPSRVLHIDGGECGNFISVGQFALIPETLLVGRKVVFVANFKPRKMGKYLSAALVLGTPHPDSPDAQAQALPIWADQNAIVGSVVF